MEKTDHLAELRRQAGLSQEDAAAALGVSRQTISRWENGASVPTGENLRAIARLYETSVDALLSGCAAPPDEEAAPADVPVQAAPKKRLRGRILAALLALLAIAAAVGLIYHATHVVHLKDLQSEQVDLSDTDNIPLGW